MGIDIDLKLLSIYPSVYTNVTRRVIWLRIAELTSCSVAVAMCWFPHLPYAMS